MSLASIELPMGLVLTVFGVIYGSYHWINSANAGVTTPAGSVMLSALPILMGVQLLLAFLSYDISSPEFDTKSRFFAFLRPRPQQNQALTTDLLIFL
jgi:hypothetical protein